MAPIFSECFCILFHLVVFIHGTQFVYNSDFNATCYSRIGGFSGAQIDYDSSTLSTTLFDGLVVAGEITIGGSDYFFLEIEFVSPINLNSAQIIWTPNGARAATTNEDEFIFTKISYYNLFTDTYEIIPHQQNQWDPIISDYILFKADTSEYDLIFTNSILFQLTFKNPTISEIDIELFQIAGEYYTWSPTNIPTHNPSNTPTYHPTQSPTNIPSETPTNIPTLSPTMIPTEAPTFEIMDHKTDRSTAASYTKYSSNIYPLSYRNASLFNFTVPGNQPYCLTCILAWSDIDAHIEVVGCNNFKNNYSEIIPNDFYNCDNGTWILTTSGRLADWQQTYGRIEIWEVDANGIEYLQWRFEYQWNTSECIWFNNITKSIELCNYLPTTSSNINTAMFEFTMPKKYADNRDAPLIVVWYDLLSIPYSIRPKLNYKYNNLTLINVGKGKEFGVHDLWNDFKPAVLAAGILLASFIAITIIACLVSGDKKSRYEFMLKTYNLRTAYKQDARSEIVPKEYLNNQSKFRFARHGPWLVVVFIARLIYMAVFTLSFFFLVFQSINAKWFDVLANYNVFAEDRDNQLADISQNIEGYYQNETQKMENEVHHRQQYCYTNYINETTLLWNEGALSQYNNHSYQMHIKSSRVNLNSLNQTDKIFVTGTTACDIYTINGAHILERDPMQKAFLYNNGTYKNTTYWFAKDNNREWDNFTDIEQLLSTRCLTQIWCKGWTWIDSYHISNTTTNRTNKTVPHYYLLSDLSDPINSLEPGVCYTVSRSASNILDFGSIDALQNRTNMLRQQHLEDYQLEVETLSESLNGMWQAIKSLNDKQDDAASYTVIVNNDPTAHGYDMDIQLDEMIFSTSSNGDTTWTSSWYVVVTCPNCPDGNFTSPHLQEIYDYIFGLNQTNLTDYLNNTENGPLPVNISNLISINPAIIEYPNLPTIDFPLKFDFDLNWSLIIGIGGALDFVLLIYRWYRTVGILARIIRGKDVEVHLKYLTVNKDDKKCCSGVKITDKLLSCIMWIHDKFFYLHYNLWKLFYWVSIVFQLLIIAAVIFMLYVIADQILTIDFINQLGTFNLMTTGIAAQRTVRNQVLSTTALSYNNYTINTIKQASTDFAETKNRESWEWNIKELERVNEWNSYFCNAWSSYQATVRDIATDGDITANTSIEFADNVDVYNMFDDDSNTSLNPFMHNITDQPFILDIELPVIQYTNTEFSYWEISQLEIEWNAVAGYSTPNDYISFNIQYKLNETEPWRQHDVSYEYVASSYIKLNDIQDVNIYLNETRFVRLVFSNISQWSNNSFEINEIRFYGSAPSDKIICDRVTFYFWSFDASSITTDECPSITPVFGNMYRGFVRTWINDQLLESHKPFILAVRNIALSPFFIIFLGIFALIVIYILGFIIEYLLIRFDLFRENVYSKISLVTTDWEDYNPDKHYDEFVDTSASDGEQEEELGGCVSPKAFRRRNVTVVSPGGIEMKEINHKGNNVRSNRSRQYMHMIHETNNIQNHQYQSVKQDNSNSNSKGLPNMLLNELQNQSQQLRVDSIDPSGPSNADESNFEQQKTERCIQQ